MRLTKGGDARRELALLDEVGQCMRDASICGLGQTAYDAIDSALRRFQPFGAGSRCLTSRSTARPSRSSQGRRCSTRAVPAASTCRRCASARRCSRRTRAASASSSSKAVECSCPRAHGWPRTAWSCARRPIARRTPASSCSSCSRRRLSSTGRRTWPRGWTSTARPRPGSATTRRPCTSPRRSTTTSTCGTTGVASSATSASTRCGEQWQNTFAISVAGRGFDAHISAEWDAALPDSACVYCGNCIAVCPTGALMPTTEFEMRHDGTWDEDEPDRHDDGVRLLRRRLQPRAARAGQPHREGDEPRGPLDHPRQPLHQGPLRLHPRRGRLNPRLGLTRGG